MQWYKKDIKKFKVKISKNGNYDLVFAMRYPTGYPYRNIKVRISQISSDGKIIYKDAVFVVIDENNKYKGDVAGQLWDMEEVFSERQELKKGKFCH